MTVYGSSRDQSPGPDEPRRPPAGDPTPWPADADTTNPWADPQTGNAYGAGPAASDGYGPNAREPHGSHDVYGAHNEPPPGPHAPYGDQRTDNVYGGPARNAPAPGGGYDHAGPGTRNVYGDGARSELAEGYGQPNPGTRNVHGERGPSDQGQADGYGHANPAARSGQVPADGYGQPNPGTRNVYGDGARNDQAPGDGYGHANQVPRETYGEQRTDNVYGGARDEPAPRDSYGHGNPATRNAYGEPARGEQPAGDGYGAGARNVYGNPGTRDVYGDGVRGEPAPGDGYGNQDDRGGQGTGAVRRDQGRGYGPEDLYGDPGRRRPAFESAPYGTPPGARSATGAIPTDGPVFGDFAAGPPASAAGSAGQPPSGPGPAGRYDPEATSAFGPGLAGPPAFGSNPAGSSAFGSNPTGPSGSDRAGTSAFGPGSAATSAFGGAAAGRGGATGRLASGGATAGRPTSGSGWQELAGPGGGGWGPSGAGGSGTPESAGSAGFATPPGVKVKAPRVTGARRTAVIVGVVAVLVIGAGTAAAATLLGGGSDSPSASGPTSAASQGKVPAGASSAPAAAGAGVPVGPADGITLSATGDVVMGMAPTGLPPNNGKGFFDPVKSALTADLEMGNLEQTITDDTGVGKCSAASAGKTCFAFRTPPAFVGNLKDAGFGLMNEANNHAYDFGPAGYQNTRKNLDSVGIKYTGWPGEIPVVDVKGVKVAVIGFASYTWSNLCYDLSKATDLIKQATTKADLVVIQVHQGAEGADKTHVKPGTEMFLGENRCDPIAFAHNAIDAGADLVIGHGPHVMRAMEFYKGHLIAYSMGNFAGYHALTVNGVLAVGGVLKVTLLGDGTFKGATLTSTKMVAPGSPRLDPDKSAISLVSGLSKSDFPTTGAKISADGAITPP